MATKSKTLKAVSAPPPNEPGAVPIHIPVAIKALAQGMASDHQQREALKWIINQACGKVYFPYHANQRDTDFALGKLFVADQIIGLINADLSTLRSGNVPEEVPTEKR